MSPEASGRIVAFAVAGVAAGLALGNALSPHREVGQLERDRRAGLRLIAILPSRIVAPVESLDRLPTPPTK